MVREPRRGLLTPDDIRAYRFAVVVPGYDVEEVRRFLDEVATIVEQGPSLPRSERFPEIGAATTRVLEAADAAAAELIAHGERRAEELESAAARRADEVIREAQARADEMRTEAERELEEAQTKRRLVTIAWVTERRQQAIESPHELSIELVQAAGLQVQRLLQDADRARGSGPQLGGTRGEASRHASDRLDHVGEVATELEAELDVPQAPPPRLRQATPPGAGGTPQPPLAQPGPDPAG